MTNTSFLNRLYINRLYIICLALLLLFLVFHLFQIVVMNEKEFKLQVYQRAADELSERIKGLEIELSSANSLDKIETLAYKFNFGKIGKIHYIRVLEGSVASK